MAKSAGVARKDSCGPGCGLITSPAIVRQVEVHLGIHFQLALHLQLVGEKAVQLGLAQGRRNGSRMLVDAGGKLSGFLQLLGEAVYSYFMPLLMEGLQRAHASRNAAV